MCQCSSITFPLGGLTYYTKLTWWVAYQGQSLFLSLADRNRPLPRASTAQLLKLITSWEERGKRKGEMKTVDKDKPVESANSDKFEL